MATVKRRRRQQRELTDRQELELITGTDTRLGSAFESPFLARAAWFEHREELLADVNPGTRPQGWWVFEAKSRPLPGESESDALERLGVLSEAERARVAAYRQLISEEGAR